MCGHVFSYIISTRVITDVEVRDLVTGCILSTQYV